MTRRLVLAFLMSVAANGCLLCVDFGPVSWLLVLALLGEFVYFNLRPMEKGRALARRIWYLSSGAAAAVLDFRDGYGFCAGSVGIDSR